MGRIQKVVVAKVPAGIRKKSNFYIMKDINGSWILCDGNVEVTTIELPDAKAGAYHVVGRDIVQHIDPDEERDRLEQVRLSEETDSPAFQATVKALAKRAGGKASKWPWEGKVDEIWQIKVPAKKTVDLVALCEEAHSLGALLFSCTKDLFGGEAKQLAVFPSTNAADVLDVLEADVGKVWKALSKHHPLLIELTYDAVTIRHDPISKPDEKLVKAIANLNADEIGIADIKRMLKAGEIALWWD
jgi:hypothetical protein